MFTKIRNFIKERKKKRNIEYSKRLLNFITYNGVAMMWASYALAYLGMEQIAETLSATIASTVIASIVGYLAKSTVENISKYGWNHGKSQDSETNEQDENNRAE